MKLLIVDDEPLILKRLEQLIVSSAVGIHEVYATSNPAEALEMLKECAPHFDYGHSNAESKRCGSGALCI